MKQIKSSYIIIASIFLVLMVFFTNCGQPGSLGLENPDTNLMALADPTPKADDPDDDDNTVEQVLKSCDLAAKAGQLVVTDQELLFEDTKVETGRNEVCVFAPTGQTLNDNLDIKNGFLRARYQQNRKLTLPANAVICDAELTSNVQNFRYDDIFFFTFNNFLLASNHKSEIVKHWTPVRTKLVSSDKSLDIYTYDWLTIRNTPFNNVANDYCLGVNEDLARCSWPVTEEQGQIALKFTPEILVRLSNPNAVTDQSFSLTITGDNDVALDCYHNSISLNVKVKYYLK